MLAEILHKFWGYSSFRSEQQAIIQSLIDGKDTLAVLPTGGGKSLCYQLPAVAAEGTAIVIAPLIALMKDQVQQLIARGIPAAYLSTTQSHAQNDAIIEQALSGEFKLLYIAPERLMSQRFLEDLGQMRISFLAVDEAHCISQWGHDFRPSYRVIHQVFQNIQRVPIIALTASATVQVQQDILSQLQLRTPQIFASSIVRPNLSYQVQQVESKWTALEEWLGDNEESSIVYCNSRKQCEVLANHLKQLGLDVQVYHAGLHKQIRDKVQEEWTRKNNQIICATSAFGMGIDKPNVRKVIHWDMPSNLAAYYQEAGRAGRDGAQAQCVLLHQHQDIGYFQTVANKQFPSKEFIKDIYQKVMNFLGVTLGEGLEQLYPFSIVQLIQQYNLPSMETLAAVKLLQKCGFWQWNESEPIKSKILFTTDQFSLQQLQVMQPKLAQVTQVILRMYGGVFYFPSWVNEFDIAKKLGIPKLDLDKLLWQLHKMGFIYYTPASGGGTLMLLSQRLPPQYVQLNDALLLQLKKAYFDNIQQVIDYVLLEKGCRNVFLAQHFGEKNVQDCGVCDHCLQKNVVKISYQDFWKQLKILLGSITSCSFKHIENNFGTKQSRQIIEYLRMLNEEGRIVWNREKDLISIK